MRVVTPPEYFRYGQGDSMHPPLTIFLAGGITGCPEWQKELISLLQDLPDQVVLFNPRRDNFPIGDPNAGKAQTRWEFEHLKMSKATSFWFAEDQIQPIVLFELGVHMRTILTGLFIGVHPNYPRKFDVTEQLALYRDFTPIPIQDTLYGLSQRIREWVSPRLEDR